MTGDGDWKPDDEMLARSALARAVLHEVGGLDLPSQLEERLKAANMCVVPDAQHEHLVRLKPAKKGRPDWFGRLDSRRGSVHESLASTYYHLVRISQIEAGIREAVATRVPPMDGWTMGFPSRQLTAEYQAFVFALRRTADYLAGVVAAFFKTDGHRIRGIADTIKDKEPADYAAAVATALDNALRDLPGLLTDDDGVSVRDRLAHFEHVDAGMFHARWGFHGKDFEIHLFAGGEQLPGWEGPNPLLSEVTQAQFDALVRLVVATYDALRLPPSRG